MANPTISIDSTHIRSHSVVSTGFSTPPNRQSLDTRRSPLSTSPSSTISAQHARVPSDLTPQLSSAPSSPRFPPPSSRKNRSALRQFYGIKREGDVDAAPMDREGFDAEKYIQALCRNSDLKELLRIENELVNEIRGFDGERKALVYDNYSKLISATDTIRKMRSSMEPLTPATSTLEPAISHIAEISSSLTSTIHSLPPPQAHTLNAANLAKSKRETVKWALAAPERIQGLVKEGKKEEAEKEWGVVKGMLDKWGDGVKGVKELREKGGAALRGE
ncbi:Vps51/Vps67-domain-containing protein [Tirmania nivea]|nr:Vps51/Vps67-domain-containing protein [Tirmania nivea]